MNENIYIDALTSDSVSVKTQKSTVIDGVTYNLGEPHRKAYVNSTRGRAEIAAELSDPYLSAVMTVWGDTPTVMEPEL